MNSPIISVENLSKRYHLGQIGATTLRESVERWLQKAKRIGQGAGGQEQGAESIGVRAGGKGQRGKHLETSSTLDSSPLPPNPPPLPLRPLPSALSSSPDDFWALKDVSFEVQPGEVLGIIGRNGAGKSTLLKILSRITEPTSGRAVIRGRVASLLEVGTGFHPELSGRENIYLNGAILGMRHAEIAGKFDAIVTFAEVEKFIDTPVKRYSSGMYVRLAFAVAAHLDPEILIVDEVLSVGDSSFQKKCMKKMGEVSKEGRTILFVSHNMAAVSALCSRVVLLESGRIKTDSTPEAVVKQYLVASNTNNGSWSRATNVPTDSGIYFEKLILQDSSDRCVDHFSSREPIDISITVVATADFDGGQIAIRFTNEDGVAVFTTANTDIEKGYLPLTRGKHTYHIRIPGDFLSCGHYNLIFAAMIPGRKLFDVVSDSIGCSIEDAGTHASVLRDARLGVVTPVFKWHEY